MASSQGRKPDGFASPPANETPEGTFLVEGHRPGRCGRYRDRGREYETRSPPDQFLERGPVAFPARDTRAVSVSLDVALRP